MIRPCRASLPAVPTVLLCGLLLGCGGTSGGPAGSQPGLEGAAVEIRFEEGDEVDVISLDPVERIKVPPGRILARIVEVRSDTIWARVARSEGSALGGETLRFVRNDATAVSIVSREPARIETWFKRGAIGALVLFTVWGVLIFASMN